MAMNGVSMPLAFTGQEYVWSRVYTERFNLTAAELAEHFAGPAFLAWGRMGNIRGWGGWYDSANITGLTQNWMAQQRDLQKQIVARERAFGMRPVLVAFAGHVPIALSTHFPSAKITHSRGWCGFSTRYSDDALLEAEDPLFVQIGKAFVEIQTEEYGTDHIYNGDTFNEMGPSSTDPNYIRGWGTAVHGALTVVDPEAVWFVQGWSLGGWAIETLQAYWSGVPAGQLISLDLDCAQSGGSWKKYTSMVTPGRPVMCGLLDNMGGRRALHGNLPLLSNQTLENVQAAPAGLIAGLGWNPEDLHANPVKWQLMAEIAWRGPPHVITSITTWLDAYARRRYFPATADLGGQCTLAVEAAWRALGQAAYGVHPSSNSLSTQEATLSGDQAFDSTSLPLPRMGLGDADSDKFSKDGVARIPSLSLSMYKSPNVTGVQEGWRLLLAAGNASAELRTGAAYRYDLVDVTRQALQDRFAEIYPTLVAPCSDNSHLTDNFTKHAKANCGGGCLPADASGNCDRMPGCGHDRVPSEPPCDPQAMMQRCLAANASVGVICTAFNTNGYLYKGTSVSPFGAYPLDCYTRVSDGGWGGPACAEAMTGSGGPGQSILQLATDLDRVLNTVPQFARLGSWIADARAFGATDQERDWLEWNARMQVTLWGSIDGNSGTIANYASKPWAGLIKSHYLPLWQHFLTRMGAAAAAGNASDPSVAVRAELLLMSEQWTNSTTPTFPVGVSGEDPFAVSAELFEKYMK